MSVTEFCQMEAYKLARELSLLIFNFSKGFPDEEMQALTAEIRRSSRAVGVQIAQAWAKRRYEKQFISTLRDADGYQQETRHWIQTAHDCGYLTEQQVTELMTGCKAIGRKINGMIYKADKFRRM
jgi:four helix bundle protein